MTQPPGFPPSPPWGEGRGEGHDGRRIALKLLAAGGLALALPRLHAAQVQPLGVDAKVPAFSAPDLAGQATAIPMRGRATIVNFWATWCPPCRAEMPLLLQLAELYGDKLALQLVNFKERAVTVQRYMQSSAWTHPVLLDAAGAGAAAWEVKTFPTTFGFDPQGRARWRVRGEYDWSTPEAGKLVDSLWT